MAVEKRPDVRMGLFFSGTQNAEAAQGMLAWSWSREAFARKAPRAGGKAARTKAESRQERRCMAACESAAE